MPQPEYWVHDLNPVIFQITETLAVRWYGLAYVLGFLTGFALLHLYWRKGRTSLTPAMQESFAMALILGVVVGGRLGYFLLYDLGNFLGDPLVFFRVWEGGMASHGGFLGVAVAVLWMAWKHRLSALHLGDLVVSVAGAGLFLGRVANFINGELWGKPTEVPWGVIFPESAPPGMPVHLIPPRHPSQLYEALLEGFLVFAFMQWRFWKVKGRKPGGSASPASAQPGHLTAEFLILYSAARFIAEQFREPDAELIMGLSRGSFYSLIFLGIGCGLLAWVRWLTNRQTR